MSRIKLLVTIDTEEEGRWGGEYRRDDNLVTNIDNVPRFQDLCERFGIRPTYLIDSPVALDDRASKTLRDIHDSGQCEIGAHLHPWCTEPFDEELSASNSYMCNLPVALIEQKLKVLTDQIDHAIGRRPVTFRAGRYGIGLESIKALHKLDYILDSSVVNYTDYSSRGGPDFRRSPTLPYRVSGSSLDALADGDGVLWEVPVNVGFNRSNQDRAFALYEAVRTSVLAKLRGVGVLDRLGWLRRIKFSPEQASTRDLQTLARIYHKIYRPCIVLMFHSSSLKEGLSPYTPDKSSLERFYRRLEAVFAYCVEELDFQPMTLEEYATVLENQGN